MPTNPETRQLREWVELAVQSRLEAEVLQHRLDAVSEVRLADKQRLRRRHNHANYLEAETYHVAQGDPHRVGVETGVYDHRDNRIEFDRAFGSFVGTD